MITGYIEYHEEQELAFFYIPVAYLHTLADEEVIVMLIGPLEELVVMLYSTFHREYVIHDSKGVSLLYAKMNRFYTLSSIAPYYSTRI